MTALTYIPRSGDPLAGTLGRFVVTVPLASFADGGSTIGTYTLGMDIPQGAVVLSCVLTALTGFAGDTTATIQVGDGTDVDRYTTSTPSVFTTVAGGVGLGAVSGTAYHAAAKTPKITVTAGSDFTAVTGGSLTLALFWMEV